MSEQKSIFITGGSGGMGLATGQRFAAEGWLVGLYDLDQAALDAHGKSDDFKAQSAKLGAFIAAPPEIKILDAV